MLLGECVSIALCKHNANVKVVFDTSKCKTTVVRLTEWQHRVMSTNCQTNTLLKYHCNWYPLLVVCQWQEGKTMHHGTTRASSVF